MKRENSDDGKSNEVENSNKKSKKEIVKLDFSLNLEDLGAGYDKDDKRIARAINIYETKLTQYIQENYSVFKDSNFLKIKGYGSDIKGAEH